MSGRLSHIREDWRSRLRRFFDTSLERDAAPLEVRAAVLDDIEGRVQPVGRGRKVFPYGRVIVRLVQPGPGRPGLEATFRGFDAVLRERLQELQCDASKDLGVKIVILKKPPPEWTDGQLFSVDYQSQSETPPAEHGTRRPPPLHVTVVKGAASQQAYTFAEPIVSIGRIAEPADQRGRVRRNHVAFLDSVDGTTETVGRAHARLAFDAKTGEYRVFDEGSRNGTYVIRMGESILVAPRDPRGVRVHSGDEIQLGKAVIRVSIDALP